MNSKDNILSFLLGATPNGFTYLAGISAIIGAILPLTTIIFAQYYDKSAERTNNMFWEMREKIIKETISKDEISFEFRKLLFINGNHFIFNSTLRLFKLISYSLLVLWILVCIGFINNNFNGAQYALTDKLTIIVSTFLLSLTLMFFPFIFTYVKKRVPIPVKKNGYSFSSIENLLLDDSRIDKNYFYKNLFDPTLSLKSNDSEFSLEYTQNIPLNKFSILWALKDKNSSTLFIKLDIHKINKINMENISYKISERRNFLEFFNFNKKIKTANPRALMKIYSNINFSQSKVYLVDHDKNKIFVSNLNIKDKKFVLNNICHNSIDGDIKKLLERKDIFMQFISQNIIKEFPLKRISF